MTRYSHLAERPAPKIKQAAPLHGFHQRKPAPNRPTVVRPTIAALPSAEDLAHAPAELLEALAQWRTLLDSQRAHARAEAAANAAANQATADYRAKIREAVSAGTDTAKVKDATERHRAEGAAHREHAKAAAHALERHGHVLGALLTQHAEALTPEVDQRITEASDRVKAAFAALEETWSEWAEAFGLRVWLSSLAMGVESVPVYHGAKLHGGAVTEAVANVLDLLDQPDKLRADEVEVRAWRATQGA